MWADKVHNTARFPRHLHSVVDLHLVRRCPGLEHLCATHWRPLLGSLVKVDVAGGEQLEDPVGKWNPPPQRRPSSQRKASRRRVVLAHFVNGPLQTAYVLPHIKGGCHKGSAEHRIM